MQDTSLLCLYRLRSLDKPTSFPLPGMHPLPFPHGCSFPSFTSQLTCQLLQEEITTHCYHHSPPPKHSGAHRLSFSSWNLPLLNYLCICTHLLPCVLSLSPLHCYLQDQEFHMSYSSLSHKFSTWHMMGAQKNSMSISKIMR